MSSIQETVAVLEAFELEDNAPNIESPSPALSLDGEGQTNYIDRSAFDTKWVEETTAMSRLVRACPTAAMSQSDRVLTFAFSATHSSRVSNS